MRNKMKDANTIRDMVLYEYQLADFFKNVLVCFHQIVIHNTNVLLGLFVNVYVLRLEMLCILFICNRCYFFFLWLHDYIY